jgi:AcrR family transcriptional regulator
VPRPREYPDDLRRQLLDTAARLLATEGPQAMSTRRVAAEVGTSTTAIYSLIGSKQELVRQLFLEGFQRLTEHQEAVSRTDDPLTDLTALGRAYHQSAIDSPYLYEVMFGSPVPEFTPTIEDATFALRTLGMCTDAVSRCIDAGILEGDPDAIAHQLWALIHGVTSLELRGMLGSPEEADRHLAALFRAAVDGYRPPQGPRRVPVDDSDGPVAGAARR